MNKQQVQNVIMDAFDRHEQSKILWGMPGKQTALNRYTIAANEAGKVWVRLLNESGEITSVTTAVNFGSNLDPKVKVRLQYIEGELTIISPSPKDAINAYGSKASQTAVPPHSGGLGGGVDDYVESQRFMPGLVTPSPLGGLNVRIYKFRHLDGHYDTVDYLIPSGSVPSNPDENRLTLIIADTDTWSIDSIDGVIGYGSISDYSDDDIDLITVPEGFIPLAAITLYNGQTVINDGLTRILDARQFLNAIPAPSGIIITDGTTTVNPALELEFDNNFFDVIGSGETAQVTLLETGGAKIWAEQLIYEKTLSADGTFDTDVADDTGRTGISGYKDLYIEICGFSSDGTSRVYYMLANGVASGANYRNQAVAFTTTISYGNTDSARAGSATQNDDGNAVDVSRIWISDYANTTKNKIATVLQSRRDSATVQATELDSWVFESTSAITRIQFTVDTVTNFEQGAYLRIWGKRNVTVGSADLDVSTLDQITPALDDKIVLGDTNDSDMASYATVLDVLHTQGEFTTTSTGTVNDLNFSNALLIRCNNATDLTLTGLVAGKAGQIVTIISAGAGNVLLAHQNAGSTASNRLLNTITAYNTVLVAGMGTAVYRYDDTTDRWRLISHTHGTSLRVTDGVTSVNNTKTITITGATVGDSGNGDSTITVTPPSSTFLSLTDTPSSYSGQEGKLLAVNSGATAVEFVNRHGSEVIVPATTLASTAASIGIASIPQTFKTLCLRLMVRTTRAAASDVIVIRPNNHSGTQYQAVRGVIQHNAQIFTGEQLATTSFDMDIATGNSVGFNSWGQVMIWFYNYSDTANNKNIKYDGSRTLGGSTGNTQYLFGSCLLGVTTAISSLNMFPLNGTANFLAGTTYELIGFY